MFCAKRRHIKRLFACRELNVDKFDLISKYIASFHFITATMMAVGYGDI